MLKIENIDELEKMKKYYRASDMINLLQFFPSASPVRDLTIIEDVEDYLSHINEIKQLDCGRVDTLKGRIPATGIEVGDTKTFIPTLENLKTVDKEGVLLLFRVEGARSQRYGRDAGIAVSVDLDNGINIEAVSKGFDGREISKGICVHERIYIPMLAIRGLCISNFKDYRNFIINQDDYVKTRQERIEFLKSVGYSEVEILPEIPEEYKEIPDYVWLSVIRNVIKELDKEENEVFLRSSKMTNFAFSGHTEGGEYLPWQMFDKSRYTKAKNIRK